MGSKAGSHGHSRRVPVAVLSEFRTADSASRLRQMHIPHGRSYFHVTGEPPTAGSDRVRVPVE